MSSGVSCSRPHQRRNLLVISPSHGLTFEPFPVFVIKMSAALSIYAQVLFFFQNFSQSRSFGSKDRNSFELDYLLPDCFLEIHEPI